MARNVRKSHEDAAAAQVQAKLVASLGEPNQESVAVQSLELVRGGHAVCAGARGCSNAFLQDKDIWVRMQSHVDLHACRLAHTSFFALCRTPDP
jgi:hypothetical protein